MCITWAWMDRFGAVQCKSIKHNILRVFEYCQCFLCGSVIKQYISYAKISHQSNRSVAHLCGCTSSSNKHPSQCSCSMSPEPSHLRPPAPTESITKKLKAAENNGGWSSVWAFTLYSITAFDTFTNINPLLNIKMLQCEAAKNGSLHPSCQELPLLFLDIRYSACVRAHICVSVCVCDVPKHAEAFRVCQTAHIELNVWGGRSVECNFWLS